MMHDVPSEGDSETKYECLDCGTVVVRDSHPGSCADCGGIFQNRAMSLE